MTFIANVLVHEIRHIVRARALFNLNHFWLALQIDHKGWENAQSNVISPCVISLKSNFIKCVKFRRIYTVGIKFLLLLHQNSGACPGICKRGGGPKSESLFFFFFFCFSIFQGGGPAQKIVEIMIFSTKKVAKYR